MSYIWDESKFADDATVASGTAYDSGAKDVGTSGAVGAGKKICCHVQVWDKNNATARVVKLQTSDTATGAFEDVGQVSLTADGWYVIPFPISGPDAETKKFMKVVSDSAATSFKLGAFLGCLDEAPYNHKYTRGL